MATTAFPTAYGEVTFDENGQANIPGILLQHDLQGDMKIVTPESLNHDQYELVYPMPSWDFRDCVHISPCLETNGTCTNEGTCQCREGSLEVSIGQGPTATCRDVPEEDMNYIDDIVKYVCYGLFGLQACLSAFFAAWTYLKRDNYVVKISQPGFLLMVALGCAIMASSILPMTVETSYRYEQDEITKEFLHDEPTDGIFFVDAMCVGWVILLLAGFIIIYAAFFAKIWRLKNMLGPSSSGHRRGRKAGLRDALAITALLVGVEGVLILLWEILDPVLWNRSVTVEDEDGFALVSVGKCSSDSRSGFGFSIALVLMNIALVIYMQYLCHETRKIPTDLSESKWITNSVNATISILVLAIPMYILAQDDTDSRLFVRSLLIVFNSIATTVFIFGPKFYMVQFERDSDDTEGSSVGGFDKYSPNTKSKSTPMAEVYPTVTVIYADIAGFTAWASARGTWLSVLACKTSLNIVANFVFPIHIIQNPAKSSNCWKAFMRRSTRSRTRRASSRSRRSAIATWESLDCQKRQRITLFELPSLQGPASIE